MSDKTKVSILTACLPAKADFLYETAVSVGAAKEEALKANVELEWIVCFDGEFYNETPKEADKVLELAHHQGVAVARNIALAHATGKFFMPLDADDHIAIEGVLKGVKLLEKGTYDWVAGNRLNMDGSQGRHWHTQKQTWPPRFLAWDWTSPFPFHPSTIIMSVERALELGGWPALPACEDVGFILEASERFSGIAIQDVFLQYRKWEKQTGETEGYLKEKELSYKFIETLINNNRILRKDPLIARPALTD